MRRLSCSDLLCALCRLERDQVVAARRCAEGEVQDERNACSLQDFPCHAGLSISSFSHEPPCVHLDPGGLKTVQAAVTTCTLST